MTNKYMYVKSFLFTLSLAAAFLFIFEPENAHAARFWYSGIETQSVTGSGEFTSVSGTPTVSLTTKRSGEASLRVNPTSAAHYISLSNDLRLQANTAKSLYFRFYVMIASAPNTQTTIFKAVDEASVAITSIRLNTDRTLELWGGTATPVQIGSDSSALATDTWYRIEVAVTANASTKITDLAARLDGVEFASVSGLSTSYTAQDVIYTYGVITAATADLYFDDMAINDNSGSHQNSYPGEGSIVRLGPTGPGDSANGVSGGANSGAAWSQVDEIVPNDQVDYWELVSNNDILDVRVEDPVTKGIGANDTISVVGMSVRRRGETASLATYQTRIKSASGGAVVNGSYGINATTWLALAFREANYTDPTTGLPWTVTGTNSLSNMQIGVIATDANPDIWISTMWALVEYIPEVITGITVSGTTNASDGLTVKLAINGSLQDKSGTTSSGAWTIVGVSPNSSDVVVAWFDGAADSAEATAVAKYSGTGDMSGLVLNTNTLTLGSDDDQTFSLSDLALYDCDDDEDIMYSSNSSTLLLEGCSNSYTAEVFSIGSGETFSNTGTVTITSTAAGALSGSGTFTNGTSATLNYAGSTLTVTTFGSTAAGNTVNYISSSSNQTVRSGTYQNLGIGTVSDSDTGRTFTLSGETIVSDTLTVGNAGSTNSDVLDTSSSGNYTLIFSSANITARGTLDGNGSTIAIIGTGTPLSVTGTFNAGTSTVQFSGGSNTNINSLSYNNLSLLPLSGSAIYTLDAGTFSVNNLTLGGGPVGVTIDADTNDPSINIRGDLVINSNATYTKGGGAIAFRKGGVQTWTDNTAGIQDLGIVQIYANETSTTLNLGSNARATSLLIDTNQEFSAGSYTFTITGSGTPLNNSGTFTPGTSTLVYNANQATNIASVSYNNLTLAPASSGGPTYTLPSGTFDVVDLVLGDGTNAVTVTAATNNPNIEIAGDFTINANAVFTKGSGGILFDKVGEQTLTDNTTAKQDLGDVEVGETSGVQSEISRVQYKSSSNTGVSTLSATLDSNATAGNLLVVLVSSGSDSLASASVTDTLGNTYQLAGGVTSATAENVSSTAEHLIFYAENIAGGANTVTINFGGEMTSVVMTVVEYSGIAAEESFDQISSSRYSSANHSGTPSSTYDSGVVTINSYRELLIGISTTLQTADIYTPAAGWTEVTSAGPASGVSHVVQEYFIEEFGTHKASGTLSSAQNIHSASIATFRVAVASITKLNLATDIKLASLTVDENHMVDLNGSNTLVLTGNGTPLSVSGVFEANTGTIEFASSGTTGTTVPSHISYYNLKLNKASNSFTMPAGNVTVKNNLEVSAGTLDLNTNDPAVTVQGDLVIDGSLSASSASALVVNGDLVKSGTFTHNNGTVAIIPNSTSTVQGGASFYNLIVSGPGKTLQFEAGDTIIVSNVLDLQGEVGSPLTITSDTGSSAWTINYQGSNPTLKHIIVRYAACHASSLNMSPGTREQVSNGGNNGSCWVFLIFGGNSSSIGGGSGGGTPQTGGGQDGGSDSGTESGSGGGEGQSGGGSGGGGNASP